VTRAEEDFRDFAAFLTSILINRHFNLDGSSSPRIWGRISGCKDFLADAQLWLHRRDRCSPLQLPSFFLPFDHGRHLDLVLVLLLAF
jgi:hypothetical protein